MLTQVVKKKGMLTSTFDKKFPLSRLTGAVGEGLAADVLASCVGVVLAGDAPSSSIITTRFFLWRAAGFNVKQQLS